MMTMELLALPAVVGLVVAVAAGVVGYCLARIKRRPNLKKTWLWLAFFLPITLPFLAFVKKGDGPPEEHWQVLPTMLAGIALIIVVIGLASTKTSTDVEAVGLPACDSSVVSDAAKNAIAGSPIGTTTGLRIIDITKQTETSSTDTNRTCSASALLNNSAEVLATYHVFTHEGSSQWFVKIQLGDQDQLKQ